MNAAALALPLGVARGVDPCVCPDRTATGAAQILEIKTMGKERDTEAKDLLTRYATPAQPPSWCSRRVSLRSLLSDGTCGGCSAAKQVQPVMRRRGWKVTPHHPILWAVHLQWGRWKSVHHCSTNPYNPWMRRWGS